MTHSLPGCIRIFCVLRGRGSRATGERVGTGGGAVLSQELPHSSCDAGIAVLSEQEKHNSNKRSNNFCHKLEMGYDIAHNSCKLHERISLSSTSKNLHIHESSSMHSNEPVLSTTRKSTPRASWMFYLSKNAFLPALSSLGCPDL